MPLFSLPLDTSRRQPSRNQAFPQKAKKRKRRSSPPADETEDPPSDAGPGESSLHAASTNPLSLTPDEVAQYKLAGLDLDQELPSKHIAGFPHRGLPSYYSARSGRSPRDHEAGQEAPGSDVDKAEKERRAPFLRMQHLSVLTTILHRCLAEGDIARASRAWAMLLRAQVNGKGIDLKNSSYWGIGAELLVRRGEKPPTVRQNAHSDDNSTMEKDDIDASDVKTDEEADRSSPAEAAGGARRWGTAEGLEKAQEYYERLILQYPYKRQYHHLTNPLDFYPAMFSCEIYGIQVSRHESLRAVAWEDSGAFSATGLSDASSDDGAAAGEEDPDSYFERHARGEARRAERKRELAWAKREEVRHVALAAAEKVAARMDDLMALPPYSDSTVLHRLRGMLALYVGDLSVPGFAVEDGAEPDGEDGRGGSGQLGGEPAGWGDEMDEEGADRRLTARRREAAHGRGLVKRDEQREVAKRAFEKVRSDPGRADHAMEKLL